jgi:hypothetical protein
MARWGSMVVNLGRRLTGRVVKGEGVGGRRTGSFLRGRPYQQPVRIALQGVLLPTDFGGGICQGVERAGLARARFPDQAD